LGRANGTGGDIGDGDEAVLVSLGYVLHHDPISTSIYERAFVLSSTEVFQIVGPLEKAAVSPLFWLAGLTGFAA
jgi:hypothetical protein